MPYDSNTIKRFTDLIPRLNEAGQVISAEDINALQEIAEALQREAFRLRDEDFAQKAAAALENHPTMNAMWLEPLSDASGVDMNNSLNIQYSGDERGIVMKDGSEMAFMTSRRYTPPSSCNVQNVLLYADYSLDDEDDTIIFELSNNGSDFTVVEPNTGSITTMRTQGSQVYLRVRMKRGTVESKGPLLYAWAVMYYDSTLYVDLDQHAQLDIDWDDIGLPQPPGSTDIKPILYHSELLGIGPDDHHPRIHRHSGAPGENSRISLTEEVDGTLWWEYLPPDLEPEEGRIALVRDPNQGDRVVSVLSSRRTIDLVYNGDRLEQVTEAVKNENGEQVGLTTIVVERGPYQHADGSTEEVVTGVSITRSEVR